MGLKDITNESINKKKCTINFYDKSGILQDSSILVKNKDQEYKVEFLRFNDNSKNSYTGIVKVYSEFQNEGDVGIENLLSIIEKGASLKYDSSVNSIKDIIVLS